MYFVEPFTTIIILLCTIAIINDLNNDVLGSVHTERVTLRLRLRVTRRHRRKVPHSIAHQTHFILIEN